jgi:hypothetical protein
VIFYRLANSNICILFVSGAFRVLTLAAAPSTPNGALVFSDGHLVFSDGAPVYA